MGFLLLAVCASMAHAVARISGTPPATVVAAHYYSFEPRASDPDHDRLTFTIRNKPAWAHFDPDTGRLYGTPIPPGAVGTYAGIVIIASDATYHVALPAFSLRVLPLAQQPPRISGTPLTRASAGKPYSFQPQASDPNGLRLAYGIWNKPAWASFDTATGRLYGTPRAGSSGTSTNILITAYDGYFKATLPGFSITVASGANAPPSIQGRPPLSVTAGSTYSFRPAASGADGNALSFSVQNKPFWASFDPHTGLLSGVPGAAAVGSYANITISVNDGHASATLPAFSIAVRQAAGSNATLSWAPPTRNTDGSALSDLAGYHLYYGTDPARLDHRLTVANPGLNAYVVTSLAAGTWYFAVSAYNGAGIESVRSEVVSFAAL